MTRAAPEMPARIPAFVRRQTAARELDISVDTFDLWIKQGIIPPATVQKGGIWLWRWQALVDALDPPADEPAALDPYSQGIANVADARSRRRAAS